MKVLIQENHKISGRGRRKKLTSPKFFTPYGRMLSNGKNKPFGTKELL
jgi:hypothetical protein